MTHDRSSHICDHARMLVHHHRWVIYFWLFVCEQYSLAQIFVHSAKNVGQMVSLDDVTMG